MAKSKSDFAATLNKREKAIQKARTIPFRDLDKDGVTYSFLAEFLNCRESARLSYVEGWTQVGLQEAFEFGNCIHNCIEAQGNAKGKPFNHNYILNKYRDKRYGEIPRSDKPQLHRIVETARIVWPAYVKHWQAKKGMETLNDCQIVSNEESFRVDHQLPNGTTIKLRGRFDGILRYQGGLWLMENKTKSVIDERLSDYLPKDMQTQMYCHVASILYKEPVHGVLYNVIRRPGLKVGKGTVEGLLERITKAVAEDPDYYFMRWNVYLDPGDTAKWVEGVLNPVLMQVQMWWDEIIENPFNPFTIKNRVHHFASPEGLYTRYGRSNYFDLLVNGNDFGLTRREKEPERVSQPKRTEQRSQPARQRVQQPKPARQRVQQPKPARATGRGNNKGKVRSTRKKK